MQYPVRCPHCNRLTAFSAALLLQTKEASCRHCQATFPIDQKVTRDIERTIHGMKDYVDKKDNDDEYALPLTDQPLDTPPAPDTTDNASSSSTEQSPAPQEATPNQASQPTNNPQRTTTQTNKQHPTKRNRRSKRKNRRPSMANG